MFYESIAKVYDYIFPKNRKQLEFIESIKRINSEEKILDIGCATGNLTSLLQEKSEQVIGIDLDNGLLREAKEKLPKSDFRLMNMLKVEEEFGSNTFDRVISFGNTLVHLDSKEEVEKFFQSVHKILKKDGYFIVQIINYDRVLDKKIESLPTIDNDKIKFVRNYEYNAFEDKIYFSTELSLKEENKVIKNTIKLLPLRKAVIEELLLRSGFKNISFYGNFVGEKLDDDKEALIFKAEK